MPTVSMPTALMPVSPAVTLEARERLLADLHSDLALARPRRLDSIRGAVLPGGQLDLEGLAAAELLAALGPEFALRGLWLADSGLGPEHADTLVQLLAAHPRLLHLDLAGNRVGPGGLATMLPAIAQHPGLRSLNLADNGLDISSTCLIGQALADRPIAHLRLAGAPCDSRTWAELREQGPAAARLLAATDLLVDGRYDASRRTLTRRYIGSDNQVLHFLSPRYTPEDPRLHAPNTLELRLRGALPPLAAPTPPLPEGIAAADLEASLRVLAVLSDRTDLSMEHPRLHAPNTLELRLRGGEITLNGWPVLGPRTRVV